MTEVWTFDLLWWITGVEIPVLAGLFWLIWRNRRDAEGMFTRLQGACEGGRRDMGERLAAYKLEATKNYASISCMKDLERRLTSHLVRIEEKLDAGLFAARPRTKGRRT